MNTKSMNKKSALASCSAFSFAFAVLFLSGCEVVDSSEVSSSTVHADYSATYHEQSNQTSYTAHFTVGGDTGTDIELDGNSAVEIDGNGMSDHHDIFNEVYYEASAQTSYQDYLINHEFYFRDQNGTVFRNDFNFPVMVEVGSVSSPTIPLGGAFTVNWIASGPVDTNDSVDAILTRSDGATAEATSYSWGAPSGAVEFQAQTIQTLGASQVQLTVCHHHSTTAIRGDASGGYLETTSCSRAVSLTIQ